MDHLVLNKTAEQFIFTFSNSKSGIMQRKDYSNEQVYFEKKTS